MYLLKCDTCGKIYKVIEEIHTIHYSEKNYPFYKNYIITDMGGEMILHENMVKCLNCDEYTPYEIMKVEDWVADLVFKVRGS